ncbi:MAG: uncharacterized protein JWN93_2332 [Hyphomicrobiales bacterium]|nr:uncharacterized protein [Hyphomicrobiales bacterium]
MTNETTFKLLVVDDSKLARMAVGKLLSANPGWARAEAANADEAVAAAQREPVHAAVLDFNMPGRDGLQLAAELRGMYPSMPLAIVSANHQVEIVNRALELGALFLSKPMTAEALRQFLDTAEARLGTAQA